MANNDGITTRPLTPDRWADFEAVLGRGGISGCWCMYWLTAKGADFEAGRRGGSKGANKAAFRGIAGQDPPPGLLAYDGAEPVGWLRVMERGRHPGLARSRIYRTDLDCSGVWSISCFVIRRQWRGRGLSAILIGAAADFARANGARALEAYPAETAGPVSPMGAYRGVASTFHRLGFAEVGRLKPDRPLMRLDLPA